MDGARWTDDDASRSARRSARFTNDARQATLLKWRFSGAAERKHPRSQTIHLAKLRKAEQPRTQPTPRPENRWDDGLLISRAPATRGLRRRRKERPGALLAHKAPTPSARYAASSPRPWASSYTSGCDARRRARHLRSGTALPPEQAHLSRVLDQLKNLNDPSYPIQPRTSDSRTRTSSLPSRSISVVPYFS
jgi:hypothetical protein